jgi:tetratricopeptide (TPR) repeat protein
LGGDDPKLRASWCASYAITWATLRDFDRSYQCLKIAHSLSPDDGWVLSCESAVFGLADRRTEALRSAERAWEVDPGSPFAAHSLGMSLLKLGHVQQAADRFYSAADNCQSQELVMYACWYQCALAETLEGRERQIVLDRARTLAGKLRDLAPLADRYSQTGFARTHLDIAELADDHVEMERWSTQARSPFHRQLVLNLKTNTEGKRIRLPVRRTLQTHEACVPTSIASALSAGGIDISADEMATEVTFGGTAEWAAADWLRERGFHVRFFSVTQALAVALIENGIAFVMSWEADESGHAVAVIGVDQRAETLLIHDPQSFRGTEYLLSVLNRDVSPLGIKGMAVVAAERGAGLDALLDPTPTLMEAAQEHQKALLTQSPAFARSTVADLTARLPSHPGTLYLQSIQNIEDGHVGQGLKGFQDLLAQFPDSPIVRVRYMSACRALGNGALVRQTLKDIVERGVLPGLDAQQDWIHPPDRYVFEYADLLRLSSETRDQAESLLHSLIRRQSTSAGAWHNLADLLWHKRDMESALLCYRIASCLATSDEHYARAYADALAGEKREEEGFQWLESRVRKFTGSPRAVATWISWISALEDGGYPERALAACREALGQQNDSPELLSFAVPFFARMGEWKRAESELSRLKKENAAAFYRATLHYFQMSGQLQSARAHAEAWTRELPLSMEARHALLQLIALQEGSESAIGTAALWLRDNKGHEEFEHAYCAQLDNASSPPSKKYSVLLRRLKRNREDAWAWREVTFNALSRYDLADSRRQQRLAPRIEEFLSECDRTSIESVPTMRAHALWAESQGDWTGAIAKSLEAISFDSQGFYSYRRIWECSSRLDSDERNRLWAQIEPMFLSSPGRLSIAREVMGLLAERFGPVQAEKTIEAWAAARPGDPDVIEAAADLLIDRGHGRSDAARAVGILKHAVERYPYHSGLRFSLANAYRRAGQDQDAENVLSEIVRRHPDDSSARIQLAWIRQRSGDPESAQAILNAAEAARPRNAEILEARIQILIESERLEDACRAIERGLEQMPENVNWRSRAIALFSRCGAHDKSIQAARMGVQVYPRGAYLWLLLGRTLNELRQFAGVGEIEKCLRQSLRFNCGLFEAADLLSIFLAEQRRFDDAAQVMRDIEKRMTDPAQVLGRLAWIKRVQGQRRDAVIDLSRTVVASPWYGWGWNLLIDWLEEDEDWEQTRRLLQEIPPQMFTNTSFRLRRLLLLEKAGLDQNRLDAEWHNLLQDFPEDVTLSLKRYDSLHSGERFSDAASVLQSILQFHPDDPFIFARQTEVLAREGKNDAALEVAIRVGFGPVEESTWPADKVWDVAQASGFADRLYQSASQLLSTGGRPTLRTFARMVGYAMRDVTKRALQPRTVTWFPSGGARQLMRVAKSLDSVAWSSGIYRAELYSVLSGYGYQRLVRRLWKKSNATQKLTINEWSQIGRALVGAHLYSEGRQFLSTWRDRPGVQMWMMTNYILCLSRRRKEQLREIFTVCHDALSGLPHDHCASYLAHAQAEASALLGDKEKIMETRSSYSAYFETALKENEYFRTEQRHLLGDIPMLVRYLQQNESWLYRKMLWKLWWNATWHSRQGHNRRASLSVGKIPWWVWWIILMLVLQVFRNSQ